MHVPIKLIIIIIIMYTAKEREDILSVFWDLHDLSRVKKSALTFVLMYKQGTKGFREQRWEFMKENKLDIKPRK